jgi:tRNA-2-methylthio-N6-dimethylallyladenosine synthase
MELLLFHSGYRRTPCKEEADLIMVNTCSIREKAEHKIYSLFGRLKALKEENPDLVFGLTGCMVQQEGESLLKSIPFLDFILGPDNIENVSAALAQVARNGKPLVWTGFDSARNYSIPVLNGSPGINPGPSAFVNIIKGCDKICSFCVVPFTRGREKSREAVEICDEVRRLAQHGAKEIILLGQNVNAYGKAGLNTPLPFHELLYLIAEIPGIERIRFMTSHPRDFTPELVRAFRNISALMEHIHLPVQSGNNRILGLMRRGHSVEDYMGLIEDIKSSVPDVAISTDIIVGFPGETENEFEDTLKLMEWVGFESSYMFSYSPRPGTKAAEFADSVPEETKAHRLKQLMVEQEKISRARGVRFLGKTTQVLIEKQTSRLESSFKGRNRQNWLVGFSGGEKVLKPGDTVDVLITDLAKNALSGRYQ